MSKAPDFQSLYEYLGDRPAGPALGYAIATRAKILKAHQHPVGGKIRETIYNGTCPDMETFKHLSKLLEI